MRIITLSDKEVPELIEFYKKQYKDYLESLFNIESQLRKLGVTDFNDVFEIGHAKIALANAESHVLKEKRQNQRTESKIKKQQVEENQAVPSEINSFDDVKKINWEAEMLSCLANRNEILPMNTIIETVFDKYGVDYKFKRPTIPYLSITLSRVLHKENKLTRFMSRTTRFSFYALNSWINENGELLPQYYKPEIDN